MNKYIHYGSTAFDAERWDEIKNSKITKPTGGLWASPIDAGFGWREWNAKSHFTTCSKENSFVFTLSEKAKVERLYTLADVDQLPQKSLGYSTDMVAIDFEACVNQGIDAIELCTLDNGLYWALYGWDCESIIILNKDVIKV